MLKGENRLRRDEDFSSIYRRSKRKFNRVFGIYFRHGVKRIGIVVSKKHGKAVKRNLLKRRIRSVMECLLPDLKEVDLIIVPREGAVDLDYRELRKNLIHVLKLGELLK